MTSGKLGFDTPFTFLQNPAFVDLRSHLKNPYTAGDEKNHNPLLKGYKREFILEPLKSYPKFYILLWKQFHENFYSNITNFKNSSRDIREVDYSKAEKSQLLASDAILIFLEFGLVEVSGY